MLKELLKRLNEVAEAETIKKLEPLNDAELLRGLRMAIAGEQEAIKLYLQIAEACQNSQVKKILESITEEEKVHIGELSKAIELIDPKEIEAYAKGYKEAEDMK
jgi:rubrerythrin